MATKTKPKPLDERLSEFKAEIESARDDRHDASLARYYELVTAEADGEEHDTDEVLAILSDLDKDAGDLAADAELLVRRRQLRAIHDDGPQAARDLAAAQDRLNVLRGKRQQQLDQINAEIARVAMEEAQCVDRTRQVAEATQQLQASAWPAAKEREAGLRSLLAARGPQRQELGIEVDRQREQLRYFESLRDNKNRSDNPVFVSPTLREHYVKTCEHQQQRVAQLEATLAAMAREAETWLAEIDEVMQANLEP